MNNESTIKDPLTGVYNRSYLQEQMQVEVKRAARYGEGFSLLFIDLDYFKSVNDAFGYTHGDVVLKELAERLVSQIRDSDLIFRFGGDEFIILLPNTSKKTAHTLSKRILNAISASPFPGDSPLFLTTSISIVSFPADGETDELLFKKADLRLHEAKRRGRNQIILEDYPHPSHISFDEISRLIERDQDVGKFLTFIGELQEKKRGVFIVHGARGSGKSRFLYEIGQGVKRRGYECLNLRGNKALKLRVFGVFKEFLNNNPTLPPFSEDLPVYILLLEEYLEFHNKCGLFVIVDDIQYLDRATKDFLDAILSSSEIPFAAIVYSTDSVLASRELFNAALSISVEMQAFSREGIHILLRSILQWEPPKKFMEWLYKQTNGYPAILQDSLSFLTERGILEKKGPSWIFNRAYENLDLAERLGYYRSPPLHNLPTMLTEFVGRHNEIKILKAFLDTRRFITVIGPGGSGKTRLAVHLAENVLDLFHDGVYFIDLTPLDSADLLADTIARAIGFVFTAGEDSHHQLMNYLKTKEMLLVIDNFEHLMSSAPQVKKILAETPEIKIIVTSREKLDLEGETLFELSGMHFPLQESIETIDEFSAVQLFLRSAPRFQPDFKPSKEDKRAIIRICQLLDGLPLGIVLAVPWLRVLSCDEIAAEIEKNLDFLTTTKRDVVERHRSLRAAFEPSWNFLTVPERRAYMKLSVFLGGFDRIAAEQVANTSLLFIATLVDKSLVQRKAYGRYYILDVLRQLVEERIAEDEALRDQTKNSHAEYYTSFLAEREEELKGKRQKEVLDEIQGDIENVRAAWNWALDRENTTLIGRACGALATFYTMRSWISIGSETFRKAAAKIRLLAQATDSDRELSLLLAKLTSRAGSFEFRLSRYQSAEKHFQESLTLFRHFDIQNRVGDMLSMLGNVALYQGECLKARELYQDSLKIRKELNDHEAMPLSLINLGHTAYQLSEYEEAKRLFLEGLQMKLESDDQFDVAYLLNNLGSTAFKMGDFDEALQYYQQSLKIRRLIGDQSGIGTCLLNLGIFHLRQLKYSEGEALLEESLDTARELGDRRGEAFCLDNLGFSVYLQEDYDKAENLMLEGLQIRTAINDRSGMATSLAHLAMVALKQNKLQKAEDLTSQSLTLSQETRNKIIEIISYRHRGQIEIRLNHREEASQNFSLALNMATDIQDTPLMLDILTHIAEFKAHFQELEVALEILLFVEKHPKFDFKQDREATKLLADVQKQVPAKQKKAIRAAAKKISLTDLITKILDTLGSN
ncbi:diguanylate cyclase [candidate division CSSED10-310 bacterium]|uniref:Diguanylate cyclase n=1 Tax=candidate division CSSED10-310 bacterium TaxID=2855610 RepID=A0ABV6Z0R4_UNCC1